MKIEYLANGAMDCPLIRMYGYSHDELTSFDKILLSMIDGSSSFIDMDNVTGVLLSGVNLFRLIVGDRSTVDISDGLKVEWINSKAGWLLIRELIAPLLTTGKDAGYHQWLAGAEANEALANSKISVVITDSSSGEW